MLMPSIFGESLFDDFFDGFMRPVTRSGRNGASPAGMVSANMGMRTDVKETENGYELEAELPGYGKEDIRLQLKNGYMVISAQTSRDNEEKDENGKFIRRERYRGSCSRTFYVGTHVKEEDIKARFENGVLKIEFPKKDGKEAVEEKKYIAIEG